MNMPLRAIKTLSPTRTQAYEQALAEYLAGPQIEVPVTGNKQLAERYRFVKELPEETTGNVFDKINAFLNLSEEAARKKDKNLQLDCLYQGFMLAFWSEYKHYMKAFEIAILLEEKLAEVTEEQYPDRRMAYFRISEGYYLFKAFDKSIELAEQAITDALPRSFTDRANLDGRKMLAIVHGVIGNLDLSDAYIRSTFESPDIVQDRPVYNAVALAHAGCNEMDRRNFRKALALNEEVLPFLKQTDDYGHVAGMYACRCFSYFGLGEPEKVGTSADSILAYAQQDWYNKNKRLKQAYTNLARYNGVIGNINKMQEYQDSLVAIYQREEGETASQYILQAGQTVAYRKLQNREEIVRVQRQTVWILLAVLIIISLFLFIIYRLYRQQRAAYKVLIEKARQWAEETENAPAVRKKTNYTEEDPNEEDLILAGELHQFMSDQKPYRDMELTLDSLADRMNISRHTLSRVINRTIGRNFNQYINEFRVREVISLMSDPLSKNLSLDELMEQAGFSGRTSFYSIFKKATGLTPAQYRKNVE